MSNIIAAPVKFQGRTGLQLVQRITCADVAVGDYIARSKAKPFELVTSVQDNANSRWIETERADGEQYVHIGRVRPGRTVAFWRIVLD